MSAPAAPLVTVVTPVYNGEAYLEECLESVLRQTYERWQCVVVNNCSTDRSLAIAESFAARDPRFRVRTNEVFVGVIQNHNIACRQVGPEAKYCKVLQADDWLFPECLAEMVAVAEAHPSVGLVGAYVLHGDHLRSDGLPYPSPVVPGREACRLNLLGRVYTFLAPTALMIRADLVRARPTYYDEAHLYSDVEACYEVLRESDFGFVHRVLTFVRRQEGAITAAHLGRFNLLALSNLEMLVRYGPEYLSGAEFEAAFRKARRRYYDSLAFALWKSGDRRRIWREHSARMAAIGRPLSPVGLLGGLVRGQLGRMARG